MDAKHKLISFLQSHKSGRNKPYTHTSMVGGAYHIPDEDYDHFLTLELAVLPGSAVLLCQFGGGWQIAGRSSHVSARMYMGMPCQE